MVKRPTETIPDQVSFSQSLAYSLPCLSVLMLIAGTNIVQGIYAKYFGIALTTIGAIVLLVRISDAITDPLIGYFSDRYQDRLGSRKPWIVAGGFLTVIAGYQLYVPPADVTAWYFGGWYAALYLGYTLFDIPHMAWGAEQAGSTTEKTKLFGFRSAVSYAGLIVFYLMPLLPFFETNDITPETLKGIAIVAVPCMALCVWWCVKRVPNGRTLKPVKRPINTGLNDAKSQSPSELSLLWEVLTQNRPLQILLLFFFFATSGAGMWYGLIFVYVDGYLNLGDQFAKVFLVAFIVGVLASALIHKLATRIGKKSTLFVVVALLLLSCLATGLLKPENTRFSALLIVKIINTIGFVGLAVMMQSLIADSVDYGTWKFGSDRAGTYFALYKFMEKATMALGVALGLTIAGNLGFDATVPEQTEQGIWGAKLAIAWIPSLFMAIALFIIPFIPLNARLSAMVQRRLTAHPLSAELGEERSGSLTMDKKNTDEKTMAADANATDGKLMGEASV